MKNYEWKYVKSSPYHFYEILTLSGDIRIIHVGDSLYQIYQIDTSFSEFYHQLKLFGIVDGKEINESELEYYKNYIIKVLNKLDILKVFV